jgi:hypothetical protein
MTLRELALYQYLEPTICIQQTKKMKRKKECGGETER